MEIVYSEVQMLRNGYNQMLNCIVYVAEQWPNGLEDAGQNKNPIPQHSHKHPRYNECLYPMSKWSIQNVLARWGMFNTYYTKLGPIWYSRYMIPELETQQGIYNRTEGQKEGQREDIVQNLIIKKARSRLREICQVKFDGRQSLISGQLDQHLMRPWSSY